VTFFVQEQVQRLASELREHGRSRVQHSSRYVYIFLVPPRCARTSRTSKRCTSSRCKSQKPKERSITRSNRKIMGRVRDLIKKPSQAISSVKRWLGGARARGRRWTLVSARGDDLQVYAHPFWLMGRPDKSSIFLVIFGFRNLLEHSSGFSAGYVSLSRFLSVFLFSFYIFCFVFFSFFLFRFWTDFRNLTFFQILIDPNLNYFKFEYFKIWTVSKLNNFKIEQF
jgi:hypothetical protein